MLCGAGSWLDSEMLEVHCLLSLKRLPLNGSMALLLFRERKSAQHFHIAELNPAFWVIRC